MANRSFYVDEIYRNENGDFYTGLALEHNEWLKDRYKFEKVADPYTTCRGKTVRCEYSQIFRQQYVALQRDCECGWKPV